MGPSASIDERWYEALGASPHTPDLWWVVERNVPWGEWVQIDELAPVHRNERRERAKLIRKGRDPGPLPVRRTIWTYADGLTPTVSEAEIRSVTYTLVEDFEDGTYLVRDGNGDVKRVQL